MWYKMNYDLCIVYNFNFPHIASRMYQNIKFSNEIQFEIMLTYITFLIKIIKIVNCLFSEQVTIHMYILLIQTLNDKWTINQYLQCLWGVWNHLLRETQLFVRQGAIPNIMLLQKWKVLAAMKYTTCRTWSIYIIWPFEINPELFQTTHHTVNGAWSWSTKVKINQVTQRVTPSTGACVEKKIC